MHYLAALSVLAAAFSQTAGAADLNGGQFNANCGNLTAAPIFQSSLMAKGKYGVNNVSLASDPDIVLVGNQWWMVWGNGKGPTRYIEPFMAYLPPGASLATTTTYPSDPNGWHIVGANAQGTGTALPVAPQVSPGGWDTIAAETPSVDVGPDGNVAVYYAGHNNGSTNFEIGVQTNVVNGQGTSDPVPAMVAQQPWEFADGLGAILEQSVRWVPHLNKFVMYYTAGAWWDHPPTNHLAYAESTDGVNWTNRQELDFPVSYYNQDFLYNEFRHRYEMVIANDPTGLGGANGRNLVWRDAATPAVREADWKNEVTLLQYDAPNAASWYNQGLLSPAVKYGNLPGEENRIYVFFHTYSTEGMSIGRFYCDANVPATPNFGLASSTPAIDLAPGAGQAVSITVDPLHGFKSAVNFTAAGFPAGVNHTFLPASSSTGTNLVIAVPPAVPAGRYPITVIGNSGNISQTTTLTLNVQGKGQAITIQPLRPNPVSWANVGHYTLKATSSSGLPVKLSVGGNATLNGDYLTVNSAGTVVIAANQDGNRTYSAAPQATYNLVVNQIPQTVTFKSVPAQTTGTTLDVSGYVSASSGLPVTAFDTSITPSVCSNAGSVISFLAPGTCTVIAIQFGNENYSAAGNSQSITVNNASAKPKTK